MESEIIHVRKTKRNGWDSRSRSHRFANTDVETQCGEESGRKDVWTDYYNTMERNYRPLLETQFASESVRSYFANLCKKCQAIMQEKK